MTSPDISAEAVEYLENDLRNPPRMLRDYDEGGLLEDAAATLRAIRAGCDTPLAVEQFCWMRNTITHNKAVANARASQYAARHVLGERDMAAKRRRGGQATAARGKAKPAGRKA